MLKSGIDMTSYRTDSFNPDRILWCCAQNGIELVALADALEISRDKMIRAVHGDGSLTITQMQKIADYFFRGLLFFYENGPVNEDAAESLQFRTIKNQKPELPQKIKNLVRRAEKQRDVFLGLLDDDEERDRPAWVRDRIERDAGETIKDFALRVRTWLRLGEANTFDSYRDALERVGVLTFVTNGYAGKWQIEKDSPIRGFSLYFDEYPVIVAKKMGTPAPQAFTIMHELGHLLLHKTSSIDDERDFYTYRGHERDANAFAGALLVPDTLLQQINLADFPVEDVSHYDDYLKLHRISWGVSGDVIVRRLHDEALLPGTQYEHYLKFKNSLPPAESRGTPSRYRYGEPLKMFGGIFVATVLEALQNEQISVGKASSYLDNLKIHDLRRLEQRIVHA